MTFELFFLGFVYTLMTLFGVGGPPYFRGVSWPVVEDFNPQDLLLQPRQVLNIDWTTTERRRNSRNCATWRPLVCFDGRFRDSSGKCSDNKQKFSKCQKCSCKQEVHFWNQLEVVGTWVHCVMLNFKMVSRELRLQHQKREMLWAWKW